MTEFSYGSLESWLATIPDTGEFRPREYKNLATHGWPDGIVKAQKYTYDIDRILGQKIQEPAITYDVTGLDYDISLVLDGTPECWYDFKGPEHKIVRVLFNPSAAGWVNAATIAVRGAMLAGLCDCLERAGNRVEIAMVYGNNHTNNHTRCVVSVKHAGDALDMDRLCFLTIHEKCLRSLWFTWCQHTGKCYNEGLISYTLTDDDKKQYDVCLDRLTEDMSEVQAIQWVREQLKKFGVELG